MKRDLRKISLIVLGCFFIAYGIFALNFSVYIGQPGWAFWACYSGMILIGFGILINSGELILSQVNMLAVPLLFWNIDFFYRLIAGKYLWGITDYFFGDLMLPARLISLEHLFLVPLSLVALYFVKIKNTWAWKFSLVETVIFYILTRLFSNPADNINYAFSSAFLPLPDGRWYFVWLLLTCGLTVIGTNWLITRIKIFRA